MIWIVQQIVPGKLRISVFLFPEAKLEQAVLVNTHLLG